MANFNIVLKALASGTSASREKASCAEDNADKEKGSSTGSGAPEVLGG
jgi:hypothetical protein